MKLLIFGLTLLVLAGCGNTDGYRTQDPSQVWKSTTTDTVYDNREWRDGTDRREFNLPLRKAGTDCDCKAVYDGTGFVMSCQGGAVCTAQNGLHKFKKWDRYILTPNQTYAWEGEICDPSNVCEIYR